MGSIMGRQNIVGSDYGSNISECRDHRQVTIYLNVTFDACIIVSLFDVHPCTATCRVPPPKTPYCIISKSPNWGWKERGWWTSSEYSVRTRYLRLLIARLECQCHDRAYAHSEVSRVAREECFSDAIIQRLLAGLDSTPLHILFSLFPKNVVMILRQCVSGIRQKLVASWHIGRRDYNVLGAAASVPFKHIQYNTTIPWILSVFGGSRYDRPGPGDTRFSQLQQSAKTRNNIDHYSSLSEVCFQTKKKRSLSPEVYDLLVGVSAGVEMWCWWQSYLRTRWIVKPVLGLSCEYTVYV
jgi:hypothetical protein